jgi:hypothetical protein
MLTQLVDASKCKRKRKLIFNVLNTNQIEHYKKTKLSFCKNNENNKLIDSPKAPPPPSSPRGPHSHHSLQLCTDANSFSTEFQIKENKRNQKIKKKIKKQTKLDVAVEMNPEVDMLLHKQRFTLNNLSLDEYEYIISKLTDYRQHQRLKMRLQYLRPWLTNVRQALHEFRRSEFIEWLEFTHKLNFSHNNNNNNNNNDIIPIINNNNNDIIPIINNNNNNNNDIIPIINNNNLNPSLKPVGVLNWIFLFSKINIKTVIDTKTKSRAIDSFVCTLESVYEDGNDLQAMLENIQQSPCIVKRRALNLQNIKKRRNRDKDIIHLYDQHIEQALLRYNQQFVDGQVVVIENQNKNDSFQQWLYYIVENKLVNDIQPLINNNNNDNNNDDIIHIINNNNDDNYDYSNDSELLFPLLDVKFHFAEKKDVKRVVYGKWQSTILRRRIRLLPCNNNQKFNGQKFNKQRCKDKRFNDQGSCNFILHLKFVSSKFVNEENMQQPQSNDLLCNCKDDWKQIEKNFGYWDLANSKVKMLTEGIPVSTDPLTNLQLTICQATKLSSAILFLLFAYLVE